MHIFYDTSGLTLEEKTQLLIDSKELSYNWQVDTLDCSKSWARQKIEMPFDEIMSKLTNKCHFVIVLRNTYGMDLENYYEVGFSTFDDPSLFLFVFVEIEKFSQIIEKFKLKIKLK